MINMLPEIDLEAVKAPEPDSERFLPWANDMFDSLKQEKELSKAEIEKVQKALDKKENERAGKLLERYFWRSIQRDSNNIY